MHYGFIIPTGDIHTIADMAAEAEAAGWDGVFYYDGMYVGPDTPIYDPWIVMAAMALRTTRVRIGSIIMPLSRRRPWKVARETVALDHLSGGRLVLPVGLGAVDAFGDVGEQTDRKVRAQLLDECLAILTGLWTGKPFSYQGRHYRLGEMTFLPPALQHPRIPIWVVGAWGSARSMGRALRYDGILPTKVGASGTHAAVTPDDYRAIRAYVEAQRPDGGPFDLIVEGYTAPGDPARAAEQVHPFAEAGATWWIESPWTPPNGPDELRKRIHQGPPRVG